MGVVEDPIELLSPDADASGTPAAVLARFHGFDLDDRPLVRGLAELSGEIITARSTVALSREQIGSTVVLVFEHADVRRPIIVGVLQDRPAVRRAENGSTRTIDVQADDDRVVISAEREIVLRCGEASITLTRAGKVLIKGAYILSRSTGYNKIKGAAIDIN